MPWSLRRSVTLEACRRLQSIGSHTACVVTLLRTNSFSRAVPNVVQNSFLLSLRRWVYGWLSHQAFETGSRGIQDCDEFETTFSRSCISD